MALSSCGGGTNTAGAGGSGIGGTGITTVTGNVSQVVAEAPQGDQTLARRLFAGAMSWVSSPVNAQSSLGGIKVFGGNRMTTTDDSGIFVLKNVAPSDNFVLSFVFEENKTITLPIGAVPAGARARVRDIVVDVNQGFATPGGVEIEKDFIPPGLDNGNNPGQGGNPPGQGGNPPGQGGTPPGQDGNPPGQDGSPGQSGDAGNGANDP